MPMRISKTVFLLLSVLWTCLRALAAILQFVFSIDGSAHRSFSQTISLYGSVAGMFLILLFIIGYYFERAWIHKTVFFLLAADLLLQGLQLFMQWDKLGIFIVCVMLLQGFIAYQVLLERKQAAPAK